MRRKALAQQGVYVKYTGCRDSWRPAPRGAGPGGSARCLRYAAIGDPSAERHQALGILLGVRPAEELCYTGRRIAAGGQVITSYPSPKGFLVQTVRVGYVTNGVSFL